MGLGAEFKEFAMKGNVVDLAVGVVIGGAFGKIVSSLVGDVIMPSVFDRAIASTWGIRPNFSARRLDIGPRPVNIQPNGCT